MTPVVQAGRERVPSSHQMERPKSESATARRSKNPDPISRHEAVRHLGHIAGNAAITSAVLGGRLSRATDPQEVSAERLGQVIRQAGPIGPRLEDGVRVHRGTSATAAARALNARAFTVGRDIVLGNSGSPHADQTLAHEVAHIALGHTTDGNVHRQEHSGGPTSSPGPMSYQEPNASYAAPEPNASFPTENTSTWATVTIAGITLSEEPHVLEEVMQREAEHGGFPAVDLFLGSIRRSISDQRLHILSGERARRDFEQFPGDVSGVPPTAEETTGAREQLELTERIAEAAEQWSRDLHTAYDSFRTLVFNAAKLRLQRNRESLTMWRTHLATRMTPSQVTGQALAESQRALIARVTDPGVRPEFLEAYAQTTSPARRGVYQRAFTGEIHSGCQYCHEIKDAIDRQGTPRMTMTERLTPYAMAELVSPASRPHPSMERSEPTFTPEIHAALRPYPAATTLAATTESMNPFFRALGPEGYQVLPADLANRPSIGPEIAGEIDRLIQVRLDNYMELIRRIDAREMDYVAFEPILQTLLPLEGASVRGVVRKELEVRAAHASATGILIGVASVAALLLTIFPPTMGIGIAMGIGLSAHGLYSGYEDIMQAHTLMLSRGTTDVYSAEQQQAAEAMMTGGIFTMAVSAIGLAGTGLATIRMIRTAPLVAGQVGLLEAAEGTVAGNSIRVTRLNTSTPHVRVVASDGTVLYEGSVEGMAAIQAERATLAGVTRTGPPGGAPPARPGGPGGGPTGGPQPHNLLVVGAEQPGEFAYAAEVAGRGHRVTVVNPRATPESAAFQARGGTFLNQPVEGLPPGPQFNMIREDFPFPLGRAYPPTAEFATARVSRLVPGGRWVVVTEAGEGGEWLNTLTAAGEMAGARATVIELPALAHEATPSSAWLQTYAQPPRRWAVIFDKPVTGGTLPGGAIPHVGGGTVPPHTPPVPPPTGGGSGGGAFFTPGEVDEMLAGGFRAEGPMVRTPTSLRGEPFPVLEIGAGPRPTTLGIPEAPTVRLLRTDIEESFPIDRALDATGRLPDDLVGRYGAVIVNNPRRYVPNLEELGRALRPGGRIIIQGNVPRNPDFVRLLRETPTPPGFVREELMEMGAFQPFTHLPPAVQRSNEVIQRNILGGPFYRTSGEGQVFANARIVFTRIR